MNKIQTEKPAPEFCLPDKDKNSICLKDYRGKWVVLYFYPKDNTSGCTIEAIDFTNLIGEFEKKNAVVIGISPDSPESHCRFTDKHNLNLTLLSDKEHSVIEKYGAWVLKKMYGREYYGVQRSTFIIDSDGKVVFMWPKVKVKGHVQEVFEKITELQQA